MYHSISLASISTFFFINVNHLHISVNHFDNNLNLHVHDLERLDLFRLPPMEASGVDSSEMMMIEIYLIIVCLSVCDQKYQRLP